jgi:hypothetical protein
LKIDVEVILMIIKRPPVVTDAKPSSQAFLAIATFLPLARWRDVPAMFSLSNKVQKQLNAARGVASYSVAFDPLHRHFWTYSIWRERPAVQEFRRAQPHATAVERFQEWHGEGPAFVEWESPDAKLDWGQAFERLKRPTFRY